jgi:cell cycle checkpoint control protein RAD9A
LAVFKQYNNAEHCLIQLDEKEQRLVFELLCKHGIKKTYRLTFEECDPVQAVYSREDALNRIVTAPKKLSDCIANFASSLEEVTLVVSKDSMKVKSHVDDSKSKFFCFLFFLF